MTTIALAAPRVAESVEDALQHVRGCLAETAGRKAVAVCFPEAHLPGLRGLDFDVPAFDRDDRERLVKVVGEWARESQQTRRLREVHSRL